MARIWASGFELASNDDFLVPSGVGSSNYVTNIVRSGAYAGRVFSTSSGSIKAFGNTIAGGGTLDAYQSVFLRIAAMPNAETTIMAFTRGSSLRAWITLDASGDLRLYDEDGQIGSESSALSTNTWYKLDLRMDNNPTAGSHVVEGRVDDTPFATSSTRDLSNGFDRVYVGANINSDTDTAIDIYFDDWKVNDSTGTSQNTYPVSGKIIRVLANAAGDNADFTRGGIDSGSNFGQIDEQNPNDATDTVNSNTLSDIDDYNIAAHGIDPGDTIQMVNVGFRQRGGGSSDNASYKLRFKTAAAGTVAEGNELTPSNTAWRTNRSSATPVIYRHIVYSNPGTADDLTPSDLDNAQIGVRISTGNTNVAELTAIWLDVEHLESAGAAVTVTPTTAALSLSSFPPTVTASDHKLVAPSTATLNLSAFAPTISTPLLIVPATTGLSISTFTPIVTTSLSAVTPIAITGTKPAPIGLSGTRVAVETSGAVKEVGLDGTRSEIEITGNKGAAIEL